jgi:hypothetical protein
MATPEQLLAIILGKITVHGIKQNEVLTLFLSAVPN